MLPAAALAQSAPDHGVLAFRYFDYRDWQPGADRMTVRSPSIYVLKPLSETLALESTVVYDAMSGASPLAFNTLSGASGLGVTDYRTAGDAKVTKYFDRYAIGVGGAYSHERDYISRAGALELRTWSEDRNRTFAFGAGFASDYIHPTGGRTVDDGRRDTLELMVGVTQVLDAGAILQSNLTYATGHGYYSDPYKLGDMRPDHRRTLAWLTRLNRYVPAADGTLKLAYRYIDDSFGADSHMLEAAWFQPLPAQFAVTPLLRYYTQRAADFYYGPPLGKGFVPGAPYTSDNRLAAYGAFTLAVKIERQFADGVTADLSLSFYEQRAGWRSLGAGSEGLLPLSARWIAVGVSKAF
ncbi:MAG: DUF3570 domain-containing protein [Casimicrobiaceae bacterium]